MSEVAPEPVSSTSPSTPIIGPGHTFGSVTDKISAVVLTRKTPRGWFIGFGIAFTLAMVLFYAIGYLVLRGIGIWGINIPVAWGARGSSTGCFRIPTPWGSGRSSAAR